MRSYFGQPNSILNAFYKETKVNFNNIDSEKLNEIMERSKEINKAFDAKYSYHFPIKGQRYTRLMELIHTSYRENMPVKSVYSSTTKQEKLLLFMFCIDPEFEAAIIYGSENTVKEVKEKMVELFGIYDPNLITIEKFVIKNLLNKDLRDKINDEIDKRAFK